MSHWLDTPVVRRADNDAIVLDLSGELWDLSSIREEADELVLTMRKYPGKTNDIEVRVLPDFETFSIAGKTLTRSELLKALGKYA